MNRFQVLSDLHLTVKTGVKRFKCTAPNLVLAGDIVNRFEPKLLEDVFRQMSPKYENIYYVAGNHEYFSRTYGVSYISTEISRITSNFKNVHFLNDRSIQVSPDLVVYGSTYPPQNPNGLILALGMQSKTHLIVSHYAPLMKDCYHPMWECSSSISRFVFDSLPWIKQSPATNLTWIFGHTHYCCDIRMKLEGKMLRFVSNPYKNQNPWTKFDETKVIEV